MQSKRQLNVELMRIFSMLLICLWHVNGHFLPFLPNAGSLVGKTLSLLMPYITFHVDLFVLITGYFGVRHLKRGLLKTSLLVIFYSLVLGALTSYLGGQDFSWTQLLPFSGSPWWFMQVYLVLLLCSPILERFLQDGTKSKMYYLLIVSTFINVYLGWFRQIPLYDHHGYDIVNFINLYVIGRCLKADEKTQHIIRKYKFCPLLIFIVCCLVRYKVQPVTSWNWWDYSSPLNIMMAISVFYMFLNLRVSMKLTRTIIFLSSSAVAVYLMTDYKGGYQLLANVLDAFIGLSSSPAIQVVIIFLFVLLLFVICCAIDKLRIMLLAPIEKYVLRKYE